MSEGIGTNIVCQVGLIVKDIEKTSRAYADVFGVPVPEIIITDVAEKTHAKYRGMPTDARAKLAFFVMGPQFSLELIEPIGESSTWKEFLDEKGEGMHHIAFKIKETDKVVAYLESKGNPMVQQGNYTGGVYTYVDASDSLKLVLELLEDF